MDTKLIDNVMLRYIIKVTKQIEERELTNKNKNPNDLSMATFTIPLQIKLSE